MVLLNHITRFTKDHMYGDKELLAILVLHYYATVICSERRRNRKLGKSV